MFSYVKTVRKTQAFNSNIDNIKEDCNSNERTIRKVSQKTYDGRNV